MYMIYHDWKKYNIYLHTSYLYIYIYWIYIASLCTWDHLSKEKKSTLYTVHFVEPPLGGASAKREARVESISQKAINRQIMYLEYGSEHIHSCWLMWWFWIIKKLANIVQLPQIVWMVLNNQKIGFGGPTWKRRWELGMLLSNKLPIILISSLVLLFFS